MSNPFHALSSHIIYAKRRSILDRALLFVFLSCFSLTLLAGQFYRYKNESGHLVLSQTLPAEYAKQGYDILNEKGRIVKTVAPALTQEQIAARDAALEAERLALIEKQKQADIDEELIKLYSQPNDAVRVLNRRIIDIDSVVKIKRTTIKSLETKIIDEESQAALRQRKGLPINDGALNKLSSLRQEIINSKAEIKELYIELERVIEEFDKKIKRLEQITEHKPTDYPEVQEYIENILESRPTEN